MYDRERLKQQETLRCNITTFAKKPLQHNIATHKSKELKLEPIIQGGDCVK